MQVNAAGPDSTSGPRSKRAETIPPDSVLTGRPRKPADASLQPDQVEISGIGRDLANATRADRPEPADLPPERMQQILDRIATGFYEQSEVREQVVRRIAKEMEI
jgi:hypothetical protein